MGTSIDDATACGIVWTRVYFDYIWAFLMHAPLSTDVPVLLLNQPIVLFNAVKLTGIGGLHCCHVGGQNKRKFVYIVCIKMKVNSQRRKIVFVPVHQHGHHDLTYNTSIIQNDGGNHCNAL